MDPNEEVLLHYGVKGMKWGVRKDGKPQGYQGPSKKSGKSDTRKTAPSTPAPVGGGGGSANAEYDTSYFPEDFDWDEFAEAFTDEESLRNSDIFWDFIEEVGLSPDQANAINYILEGTDSRAITGSDLKDILTKKEVAVEPTGSKTDFAFAAENRVTPAPEKKPYEFRKGGGNDGPFNPNAKLDTTNVRKRKLQHEDADPNEEVLLHYGVLGMKWGVRKNRKTGQREGTPVEGTPAAKHSSPSVSPSASTSSSSTVSTPQLQETVQRLRLEQEYKKLTAAPPAKKGPIRASAEQAVISALTNVGKKQLEHLLNSAIQTKSNQWMLKNGINPLGDGDKKKKKDN